MIAIVNTILYHRGGKLKTRNTKSKNSKYKFRSSTIAHIYSGFDITLKPDKQL